MLCWIVESAQPAIPAIAVDLTDMNSGYDLHEKTHVVSPGGILVSTAILYVRDQMVAHPR